MIQLLICFAHILANIRPQQVNFFFCDRVCKTTQKLKSHIRSHHLKAAAYKCPVCDRSCGYPYSLNQHKKTHLEAGRKYLYAIYSRDFVSKIQVNEHTKRHQQGRVSCNHCSKSFTHKKSLQDHLKICVSHPKPAEVHPQPEEQPMPHKCNELHAVSAFYPMQVGRAYCITYKGYPMYGIWSVASYIPGVG